MKNKIVMLIFGFLLLFIFCINLSYAKDKIYQPYPIIFVSGIGTSDNQEDKNYPSVGTWSYILSKYKRYFVDDNNNIKYVFGNKVQNYGEFPYLEFLPYNGYDDAITNDADLLYKKINNTLSRYYISEYDYTFPCNKPKVIIICHSMGGLI